MKNLIFGKTIEQGNEFLDNLIGEFKYKEVQEYRKNREGNIAILTNSDIYKVVASNSSLRGQRCHRAYIQNGINQEIIDEIILPRIIAFESPLKENETIVYWD